MKGRDHAEKTIFVARGVLGLFLSCVSLDGTISFRALMFNSNVINYRFRFGVH